MSSERKPHTLAALRSKSRPTSIIFFDTETRPVKEAKGHIRHYLKVGIARHYRTIRGERLRFQSELVFTTAGEFWEYVNRKCYKRATTYLVAHNIIFDLAVVDAFTQLAGLGWKLESFYSKGITSLFRWVDDKRRLYGVDNTNLFPGKLERWGRVLGFPKLQVDFDTVSLAELTDYCRRDVEIMHRSWITWLGFLDEHDAGGFKPTVGSTAFSCYRHRFMPARIFIHNDPGALMLEREAYRGGRVDVFFQGSLAGQPFYYLDVNNMYGYVLRRYFYPAGIYDYAETESVSMLIRKLEQYAVIASVTVQTDKPVFPVKLKGRTIYPVGLFNTTLTTPELFFAFQNGWVRGVSSLAWYRQAPLFRGYVEYFYTLRQEYKQKQNDGYVEICKLLVNSLYGKFGQSGFKQERIGDTDPGEIWTMGVYDAVTGEYYRHLALGGGVYEERKQGEAFHSFPGIAAHVTAYARLHLWRLISQVPERHVYYCDTDSLIVDQVGLDSLSRLIDPDRMGYLKVEHSATDLTINAPKDYIMGDRSRHKGIRETALQVSPNVYNQERWYRLAGMIREGSVTGALVVPVTKRLDRRLLGGSVDPDGWVSPLYLFGSPLLEVEPQQLRLGQRKQPA